MLSNDEKRICDFCKFTNDVNMEDAEKNGFNCINCGRCLVEKNDDCDDDMTEQEKISEVIRRISKDKN